MKIINKKSFYFGIILLIALVFINIAPDSSVQKGNIFDDWIGYVFTFILGLVLIFYGLFPNSLLGRIGQKMYAFYTWVHKQNKKK